MTLFHVGLIHGGVNGSNFQLVYDGQILLYQGFKLGCTGDSALRISPDAEIQPLDIYFMNQANFANMRSFYPLPTNCQMYSNQRCNYLLTFTLTLQPLNPKTLNLSTLAEEIPKEESIIISVSSNVTIDSSRFGETTSLVCLKYGVPISSNRCAVEDSGSPVFVENSTSPGYPFFDFNSNYDVLLNGLNSNRYFESSFFNRLSFYGDLFWDMFHDSKFIGPEKWKIRGQLKRNETIVYDQIFDSLWDGCSPVDGHKSKGSDTSEEVVPYMEFLTRPSYSFDSAKSHYL